MKGDRTNYLILIGLCSYLGCAGSNIFVSAQTINASPNEIKIFGSSLKKSDDLSKRKAISTKQNKITADEHDLTGETAVIRIETTLILNEVLVLDKNGNNVKDLKKDDFVVRENNELQEINAFIPGDSEIIPRSIVLIIDYSGSQLPYIETSINAAKILVDKLNPNDRMAIVTDNIELLQNFTSNKVLLKDQLESLKTNALSGQLGFSRQYSSLMATLNEMFNEKDHRPIIIFQTDGDELFQLKEDDRNFSHPGLQTLNFSYKDILTATEKTRATIYSIVSGGSFNGISDKERLIKAKMDLESGERMYFKARNIISRPNKPKLKNSLLKLHAETLSRQQRAIAEIAKFTGGCANYLERPEQAEQIYSEILSGINRRYVIGYYPTNQRHDGKRRKVVTEVRGHPEYKILGRTTYILSNGENKSF